MGAVCLISCVAKKATHPTQAQYLYKSAWFRLARRYAKTFDNWFILSAKYGLVAPDEIVAPYDSFMGDKTAEERKMWALDVAANLEHENNGWDRVVLLAGKKYRDPLKAVLEGLNFTVEVPMEGLGIGQQLAWLNAHGPQA